MEKINGFTVQEAEELMGYVAEGRKRGEPLCRLFERYGARCGRAGGSVRNYYYQFLKCKDERAREIVGRRQLRAGRIRAFSEAERDEMLRKILSERAKGCSVRRAIANVCEGDEKQMLRYQNKYRNLLKKQPELIERAAKSLGVAGEAAFAGGRGDALKKRLEKEINELYDRLALTLREENARLKKTLEKLEKENEVLRLAAGAKEEKG